MVVPNPPSEILRQELVAHSLTAMYFIACSLTALLIYYQLFINYTFSLRSESVTWICLVSLSAIEPTAMKYQLVSLSLLA